MFKSLESFCDEPVECGSYSCGSDDIVLIMKAMYQIAYFTEHENLLTEFQINEDVIRAYGVLSSNSDIIYSSTLDLSQYRNHKDDFMAIVKMNIMTMLKASVKKTIGILIANANRGRSRLTPNKYSSFVFKQDISSIPNELVKKLDAYNEFEDLPLIEYEIANHLEEEGSDFQLWMNYFSYFAFRFDVETFGSNDAILTEEKFNKVMRIVRCLALSFVICNDWYDNYSRNPSRYAEKMASTRMKVSDKIYESSNTFKIFSTLKNFGYISPWVIIMCWKDLNSIPVIANGLGNSERRLCSQESETELICSVITLEQFNNK